jgi:hypothetical protein
MKIAIGLLMSTLLLGCASADPNEPLPFLPMLAPPPPGTHEIRYTAAQTGKLVVEKGCVKIMSGRHAETVLWHQGTELGRDASGLFLRETHSGQVVRFGTTTTFGGGNLPEDYVARAYPELAQRCGPPYGSGWIGD